PRVDDRRFTLHRGRQRRGQRRQARRAAFLRGLGARGELLELPRDGLRQARAGGMPVFFGAGDEEVVQGGGGFLQFAFAALFAEFLDAVVASLDPELLR